MISRLLILFVGGASGAIPAFAHHNAASHYLLGESTTVEGVVTKFEMINPHARLHFNVTNEDGEVEAWLAEGNSHGVLVRRGWSGDELAEGDEIRILGRPSRDGSNLVLWTEIEKSDGTLLYGGNTIPTFGNRGVPEERRQNFENIRRRHIEARERAQREGTANQPGSTGNEE